MSGKEAALSLQPDSDKLSASSTNQLPDAGQTDDQVELPSAIGKLPFVGELYSQSTANRDRPAEFAHHLAQSKAELAVPKRDCIQLTIMSGEHVGESRIVRSRESLIVGRAPDATWQLAKEAYLSRHHFRIEANDSNCRLVDMGSTNGTFVNGKRDSEIQLASGDRIECGPTVFAVKLLASEPTGNETTQVWNHPPAHPHLEKGTE